MNIDLGNNNTEKSNRLSRPYAVQFMLMVLVMGTEMLDNLFFDWMLDVYNLMDWKWKLDMLWMEMESGNWVCWGLWNDVVDSICTVSILVFLFLAIWHKLPIYIFEDKIIDKKKIENMTSIDCNTLWLKTVRLILTFTSIAQWNYTAVAFRCYCQMKIYKSQNSMKILCCHRRWLCLFNLFN